MPDEIICGDCIAVMKEMQPDSVDLVVTSPPYMSKRSDVYQNVDAEEYLDFLLNVSEQVMRVLKPTGSFILNIKEGCSDGVRQTHVLQYQFRMAKSYRWVDTFIWYKTNPFPIGGNKRLKDAWEHCFHFTKTKDYQMFPEQCLIPSESPFLAGEKKRKNKGEHHVNNGSGMNISKRIVADMVRPSNVLKIPSSCLNIQHPAMFPIGLPQFFINLMTKEGDVVLDPFVGSGTTAIAAKQLKRRYIGIDTNPAFVDLTNERLAVS